ncbi:MAG: DUF1614 domain-containing protein [Ktedonobacterales bacterium]
MNRQYSGHPLWTPLMVIVLTLFLLLAFAYLNLAEHVFRLLGLSSLGAFFILGGSLFGSMINIPLTRQRIKVVDPRMEQMPAWMRWILPIVHYYPPAVVDQVVAVNVGGAIIPVVFSAYLLTLPGTKLIATLAATTIVVIIAKLLARPMPGVGVTLPTFIPPLVAAVAAHFLVVGMGGPLGAAAPVAYISGTLGTLIGADLLNLPRILRGSLVQGTAGRSGDDPIWSFYGREGRPAPKFIASIGGAGIFDGIFLTSILAPILAVL